MDWSKMQQQEKDFWGTCQNTYNEETKQLVYAEKMGLYVDEWYCIDVGGRSVLDIGGGPTSLLLKCVNLGKGKVVDPIQYPQWVIERYKTAGIDYCVACGEDISEQGWDDVWIYNVLTHVCDSLKLMQNVRVAGKIVRIFEWIHDDQSCDVSHGRPLSVVELDNVLGGTGRIELLDGSKGCGGVAYYGVFEN